MPNKPEWMQNEELAALVDDHAKCIESGHDLNAILAGLTHTLTFRQLDELITIRKLLGDIRQVMPTHPLISD